MRIATTKSIVGFTAGMLVVVGLTVVSGCSVIGIGGPKPVAPTMSTAPGTSATAAKLFPDDLKAACQGATVSRATPYDTGAQTHKVVLFSPYGGGSVEDMSTLPEDWMVQFDANSDAYAKVDTVACVEVKDEQPLKECTGYQDDGHDTSNTVDLRSADYTVSVHEATTGKELGRTELPGTDDECPMFVSFDNDSQTKVYYSQPSKDDLVAFIKPFVQP
jgi:hypothetical protein